ncbi:hypothetical protein ABPG77_003154 [Micractinium sp. CCAP 211/92]
MARYRSALSVLLLVLVVSHAHGRELQQLTGLLGGVLGLVTGPQLPPLPLTLPSLNGLLQAQPDPNTPKTGPFLYVWAAYGKSYTDPLPINVVSELTGQSDFLATIDLNKTSPTYRKIIHIEPIGSTGNEPHHISTNYDGTRIVGSGLLSFIGSTQPLKHDFYQFDIASDPRKPKFLKSSTALLPGKGNAVGGAVADHVFGLADGTYLTTQMGGKTGAPSGSLTIFDADLNSIGSWNLGPNADNSAFDPHGADVKTTSSGKLLLTSDFVNPLSTVTANAFQLLGFQAAKDLIPYTDIIKRQTVRVWDFDNNVPANPRTIQLPGAQGVIDVKFIPGRSDNLALATGVFGNQLYWVDPDNNIAGVAYQFPTDKDYHPHLLAAANDKGTRFLLSGNKAGQVYLLDTSNPKNVKILDIYSTGANSSPHYIVPIEKGGNQFAVADYFLDQGAIGAVHAGGNKRVFVLEVDFSKDKFVQNTAFYLDFAQIPARPHGIATSRQYIDVEK